MTAVGPNEPPDRSAQKPTVCLSGLLEFKHSSPPSRFRREWRGISIFGRQLGERERPCDVAVVVSADTEAQAQPAALVNDTGSFAAPARHVL